jgi:hypothetical protein
MRVILFQPRFAELVRSGAKTQTIRKTARCAEWDKLSLRRWTGKPYRSKQEVIFDTVCVQVRRVALLNVVGCGFTICLDGYGLPQDRAEQFARSDGFACAEDMADWFTDTHGLPFEGDLIQWSNAEGQGCRASRHTLDPLVGASGSPKES